MGLMNTVPKVSIGVPVYNGEKYLAKTLDSLLAQTFNDIEIIISNNASTDSTEQICLEYVAKDARILYHHSEINRGAAWNFNNTFHLAKGAYFKWAAHDDLHHPEFVARCVEILEARPEVVLCFARTNCIDEDGNIIKELKYPIDLSIATRRQRFLYFASAGHIVHEIFGLIRSDILRNTPLIGSYFGSDLVLLGKLSLSGPFFQIPEILFEHREHAERSMINPQGAKNTTEWYDSSKNGKYVLPRWRRLFEDAKTLMTHPMDVREKLLCMFDLLRVANWNKQILLSNLSRFLKVVFPLTPR